MYIVPHYINFIKSINVINSQIKYTGNINCTLFHKRIYQAATGMFFNGTDIFIFDTRPLINYCSYQ